MAVRISRRRGDAGRESLVTGEVLLIGVTLDENDLPCTGKNLLLGSTCQDGICHAVMETSLRRGGAGMALPVAGEILSLS